MTTLARDDGRELRYGAAGRSRSRVSTRSRFDRSKRKTQHRPACQAETEPKTLSSRADDEDAWAPGHP